MAEVAVSETKWPRCPCCNRRVPPDASHVALTTDEISQGIAECLQSAHECYTSGVILNAQDVRTTARALLILALEEYGKLGWLYRALMLPSTPSGAWCFWWWGFRTHTLKIDTGRLMMTALPLLPGLAPFLRHRFPFFQYPAESVDRHKQAMLYVDFDAQERRWRPPKWFEDHGGIDNKPLIENVENAVRYVARNKAAKVFDPRVIAAYFHLNQLAADDERDRFTLLRLFEEWVLRQPTERAGNTPLEVDVDALRCRHLEDAEQLTQEWTALRAALHGDAGSE